MRETHERFPASVKGAFVLRAADGDPQHEADKDLPREAELGLGHVPTPLFYLDGVRDERHRVGS